MAVLDAAPGRLQNKESGIRPFDIGRDLRPVAELIADAFTNELDPRGVAALREMRIMSHLSGLLKLLSRSTSELDDVFSGFVWVEDGRIVGNITVQRADKYGNRWQIANVAVSPACRGRGIATQLVDRALWHVEESGGQWAVLQVYDHNAVARKLYKGLGFAEVGGTVDLKLTRLPQVDYPVPIPNLTPFAASNWQPLYELANNQHSVHAKWWRAIRRSDFQPSFEQQIGEWLWHSVGRRTVYRRALQLIHRFDAALILTVERWRGEHKFELWTRPDQYGLYEMPLVQWSLARLQEYPRLPVIASISSTHSHALEALQTFGFRSQQTLLTMHRRIGGTITP